MTVKTENLCILMTDIVGYTEASTNLSRQEMEKLLNTHNQLLLPLVRAFKGWHVKSIGDALLLTFKSPTDAMLCAMAMQDRLHEYNLTTPLREQIHIRVAASLGEVRVTKSDIFGDPVNLTSRIESITPADEIYLSEAVYLAMNKAEVPVKEVGLQELKGVPAPVRVFCIPRFTTNRLVAEPLTPSNERVSASIQFPFGGAHVLAVTRMSGAWKSVPMMSAAASPKMLLGGAAALLIVGAFLLGLFSHGRTPSGESSLSASSGATSVVASAEVALVSSAGQASSMGNAGTPLALENSTGGIVLGTNEPPKPQLFAAIEASLSSFSQNNFSLGNSSNSSAAPISAMVSNSPHAASSAASSAGAAKVAPAFSAPQYRRFSTAKEAYRAGRITKQRYKAIVSQLDAELDQKIEKLKMDYRAGKFDKLSLKERARSLKLSYE